MTLKPSYAKWKARLAGEKVPTFTEPDENDVGCYRLPIKERKQNAKGENNGQWKTVGYKPVLLGVMDGILCCQIGDVVVSDDVRNDSWTSFVRHPITEDAWKAAQRGEPWPDFAITAVTIKDDSSEPEVTLREVASIGHNEPPAEPIDVQHATAIDNAIAAAIKAVTNEAEAAQALGSKNRIAELRLAADKCGKSLYEPIYRTYTAEQKKWSPIVARATAKEKELNTELLRFRERERLRIAAEQAEADRKQREIDEANQRAADRAIAAGEPEPEPIVETVDAPVFEPAPILPTYGTRKLKEDLKKFVVIDDISAVFTRFKSEPQVIELLTKLAQSEINSGRNVPGTHTREGLI